MSDTASKMPVMIRVAQDADGFWTCREAISGSPEYVRADIVERMAEAASKFVAVCSDKRGEWTGRMFIDGLSLMDSFAEIRTALTSYREATNDK